MSVVEQILLWNISQFIRAYDIAATPRIPRRAYHYVSHKNDHIVKSEQYA